MVTRGLLFRGAGFVVGEEVDDVVVVDLIPRRLWSRLWSVTGADSGSGCAGSLNQFAMDSFPLARRSVVFVSPNVGSNPTLSTALLTTGASFR